MSSGGDQFTHTLPMSKTTFLIMPIACLAESRSLRQERVMRRVCHGALTIDSRENENLIGAAAHIGNGGSGLNVGTRSVRTRCPMESATSGAPADCAASAIAHS